MADDALSVTYVDGDALEQPVQTFVYATHTLAGHAPIPGTVYGSLVARFPDAAHTAVRADGTVGDVGDIRFVDTGNDCDGDGDGDSGITTVVALFHRRTPGTTTHDGYIARRTAFQTCLARLKLAITNGDLTRGGLVFPAGTGCGGSGCRWVDYHSDITAFAASLPPDNPVFIAALPS